MLDLLKKGMLTGLGIAVVAREKLEAAAKRLVDEGKMSQTDAEKLLADLLASGEAQWKDMENRMRETMREMVSGLHLCTRQEFEELRARVDKLEKAAAPQGETEPGA